MRPEIFVECNEIQVYTVQHQLNTHEHGDQVSPREETKHRYEEQCSAYEKQMI